MPSQDDATDDQFSTLTLDDPAGFTYAGLRFRVTATILAGERRYRVHCLTCGSEAGVSPTSIALMEFHAHAIRRHAELSAGIVAVPATDVQRARWARAAHADGRSFDAWVCYVLDLAAATIEEVRAEAVGRHLDAADVRSRVSPPSDPARAGAVDRLSGSRELQVWADGACRGNPGPAGVGVVIVGDGDPASRVELAEFIGGATNNIAELTAIERGLQEARRILGSTSSCARIVVHSDSEYAIGVLTHREWRLRANVSLIQRVRSLVDEIMIARLTRVEFVKVAGHAGVPLNERADALASSAIPC